MTFDTKAEVQLLNDALNDALASLRDTKSKLEIATRCNHEAYRRMEDAKRRLAIFWEDMARVSADAGVTISNDPSTATKP